MNVDCSEIIISYFCVKLKQKKKKEVGISRFFASLTFSS
jgi:hypothetical protein